MLFSSPVYSQASGSVAGLTYSHNKGGMYARARVTPTDPATERQEFARFSVSNFSNRWINTLSQSLRNTWELYAANVTLVNALGDSIYVSGLNHYIRSNAPRHQIGLAVIDQAPSVFDLGTHGGVTVTIDATTGIDVAFNAADDWNIADGGLLIQIGMPVNPTVNYYNGPWRQSVGIIAVDTSPATIPNVFPVIAGNRQFLRIRASQADGRLSPATILGPFTVV